jgi:putative glutamine amidotransferase
MFKYDGFVGQTNSTNWHLHGVANGPRPEPILPDNQTKNTETAMKLPPSLVWLPADHRLLGEVHKMPFLVLGDKYARALKEVAKVQPVMFPLANSEDIDELLDAVDGVTLTGSPSNIHPSHFGEDIRDHTLPLDATRDALTLDLVRACVKKGIPLLGVCRGFQEINVAMGGSLMQQVHEQDGMLDHRENKSAPVELQYGLSHCINLAPGSKLALWAGQDAVEVNSLHGQGVGRLAQGLRAVAYASDGLIEAFEVEDASAFALAVQWHPEWRTAERPFYAAIFHAFGDACRDRQRSRVFKSS